MKRDKFQQVLDLVPELSAPVCQDDLRCTMGMEDVHHGLGHCHCLLVLALYLTKENVGSFNLLSGQRSRASLKSMMMISSYLCETKHIDIPHLDRNGLHPLGEEIGCGKTVPILIL